MINVLHNLDNLNNYQGLPQDPQILYPMILQFKQNPNHPLHKGKSSDDQWNILCPISQQTDSQAFSVTLLVTVIRSVIGLKPKGG